MERWAEEEAGIRLSRPRCGDPIPRQASSDEVHLRLGFKGVHELEWGDSPPCITARRGGRAIKKNIAKPPLIARTGWFSNENGRKTTPSAAASVASRHFFDDASTPPCGDAR